MRSCGSSLILRDTLCGSLSRLRRMYEGFLGKLSRHYCMQSVRVLYMARYITGASMLSSRRGNCLLLWASTAAYIFLCSTLGLKLQTALKAV
eukprot:IDg14222t1